ncbi:MAG: hypothetical protein ACOZNI_37460 [Myxococcota bacterium]
MAKREEPGPGEEPVVIVEARGEWGERRDERVEAPVEGEEPEGA